MFFIKMQVIFSFLIIKMITLFYNFAAHRNFLSNEVI